MMKMAGDEAGVEELVKKLSEMSTSSGGDDSEP